MREHGLHIITDPGVDRPLDERPTFQCSHCGGHFTPTDKCKNELRDLVLAGASTHELMVATGGGYCAKCDGPYCGQRGCNPDKMNPHVHWEQRMENLERVLNQVPTIVIPGARTLGG